MTSLLLKRFTTTERDGVKIHRGMVGNNQVEIKETPGRYCEKLYHAQANGDPKTTDVNMDEGGLMMWIWKHCRH